MSASNHRRVTKLHLPALQFAPPRRSRSGLLYEVALCGREGLDIVTTTPEQFAVLHYSACGSCRRIAARRPR